MEITPTPLGARVDVTDVALPAVIEAFADAFADAPILAGNLLQSLADARTTLKALRSDAAHGRDVSDQRIESAACAVDGIRDALIDLMDPRERVEVSLMAAGCRRDGGALIGAADAAEEQFRTAGQASTVKALLPVQKNRRAAA